MGKLPENAKGSIVAIEAENKNPNTSISSIPRKMLVLGSADSTYQGAKDKIIPIGKAKQAERFGLGSQLQQMLKGIFDISLNFANDGNLKDLKPSVSVVGGSTSESIEPEQNKVYSQEIMGPLDISTGVSAEDAEIKAYSGSLILKITA